MNDSKQVRDCHFFSTNGFCVTFSSCWLSTEKGVIWAFVAPMLAIILVSLFVKLLVCMNGWHSFQPNCSVDAKRVGNKPIQKILGIQI